MGNSAIRLAATIAATIGLAATEQFEKLDGM